MSRIIELTGLGFAIAALSLVLLPFGASQGQERESDIRFETPGPIPLLHRDYGQRHSELVLITNDSVRPRVIRLRAGESPAWVSYASQPTKIVFEREVAKAMVCHQLVNFTVEDDRLQSADLHTGDFVSFCELEPGRYRYRVLRGDDAWEGASSAAVLREGVILVSDRS